MMPDLLIRSATTDDAAALAAIYAPYVTDTAITFDYDVPAPEAFASRIAQTQERYPFLVAESQGRVVGYAYAGPLKDRVAYDYCVELTIYVDPTRHRTGVGRALYTALEEALRTMGVTNLYACVAYPPEPDEHLTTDSVRFHERMGFVIAGHYRQCGYKFGRWYDVVWMEKLVGDHPADMPPLGRYAGTASS